MRVTVIMCTWSRVHTFSTTLRLLENQTYKDFDFVVWNNNPAIKDELESMVEGSQIEGTVITWEDNIGGIGRFYAARKVATPYVIFIDDDQLFDENFISTLIQESTPDSIVGWWSWNFRGDYHRRAKTLPGQEADYIGTGGMICPSNVFQNNALFEDLPMEFLFIEDLWLVRFFKKHYNGKLVASKVQMNFMPNEDQRNQHHNLTALKSKFYTWLVSKNY